MPSIKFPALLKPLVLLIPVLMLLTIVLLLRYPALFAGSESSMFRALTIDLTFSIPLVYFLAIRKRQIPNITIVPVFILGVVLATLLIPQNHQQSLELIKTWVFPLVELSVLSLLVYKVVSLKKAYKQQKAQHFDFMDAFKQAALEVLPTRVAGAFTTEASMFYYAFFAWKKTTLAQGAYSYHKNSGIQALLAALLMAVVVETLAIHFIIAQWSHIAAWILTGISAYTGIQIFAYIKSVAKRPTLLEDDKLVVRNGLMGNCEIPLHSIEKLEVFSGDLPETYKDVRKASMFYQNVVLHLNQQVRVDGLYGMHKKTDVLAFYIDDVKAFEQAINTALKA